MTPLSHNPNLPSLPTTASIEDIKKHLQKFKIHAINLITNQISDINAKHLEPKEIKTLTDTALNLEDSYSNSIGEGEQARKIHRILDKYSNEDILPPAIPSVFEADIVELGKEHV